MSQVIMLLLFPIGLYFYFFKERPARPAYNKVFTDFEEKIQNNHTLSDTEKMKQYKEMLLKNEYIITEESDDTIIGETKIFSMSLFAMSVGVYYIGAVFYLLYYFYIQTPHKVIYKLQKS